MFPVHAVIIWMELLAFPSLVWDLHSASLSHLCCNLAFLASSLSLLILVSSFHATSLTSRAWLQLLSYACHIPAAFLLHLVISLDCSCSFLLVVISTSIMYLQELEKVGLDCYACTYFNLIAHKKWNGLLTKKKILTVGCTYVRMKISNASTLR